MLAILEWEMSSDSTLHQWPNEEQVNEYGRRTAVNNERNDTDTTRHETNTMPSKFKIQIDTKFCVM